MVWKTKIDDYRIEETRDMTQKSGDQSDYKKEVVWQLGKCD